MIQDVINKILNLCIEKGFSGKEIGSLLGLQKSPLTDWKNGKSKPTLEQFFKLCEIFAITPNYFLDIIHSEKLSDEEIKLIEYYKGSDTRGKEDIMHAAKREYERQTEGELSTSKIG